MCCVHGGVNEGRLFGRVWYGTEGFKNVKLTLFLWSIQLFYKGLKFLFLTETTGWLCRKKFPMR